jgi:magnesium chelatase family protein
MAHRGVLFLDELPEYRRNVLEVLRQPLEEGVVRLARANQHVAYPCEVMLVGAMNPCYCGYFNVPGNRACTCGDNRVLQYHTRVSGPLLDRFDISLETRPVDVEALAKLELVEKPTAWYRARVEQARAIQRHRFRDELNLYTNADMGPGMLRRVCVTTDGARRILTLAVKKFGWSARAHDRMLKLARTRADLEGHEIITDDDMRMVIGCRTLDRSTWLEQGLARSRGGGGSLLDVTSPKRAPRPPPSSLQ